MRTRTKALVVALVALLPLTMAPSGGFPSRPRFQQVTIANATPSQRWFATGAVTDRKDFRLETTSTGQLQLNAYTDAGVLMNTLIIASRSSGGFTTTTFGHNNGSVTLSGTTTTVSATGTLNLTGANVQANGVALATLESGTFGMTQTGCSGSPSNPSVRYVRTGLVVVLELPTVACASNSTSWSWSGIPAALRPAGGWTGAPLGCIVDNGAQTCGNGAVGIDSTGTINFLRNGSVTGWTNAGTKNIAHFTSITYGVL